MNKTKAIEIVNQLPEHFELDILIDKLVFVDQVEKGMSQLNEKRIFTHEQVKQKVSDWQSS